MTLENAFNIDTNSSPFRFICTSVVLEETYTHGGILLFYEGKILFDEWAVMFFILLDM